MSQQYRPPPSLSIQNPMRRPISGFMASARRSATQPVMPTQPVAPPRPIRRARKDFPATKVWKL
ncbi:hypothetical protein Tsubulata_048561 [Turnera subulata]|uniref:Uncharacterized protein n=1 Tax=Turnera subulata TaxID=218843 RepID=A0A9Q0J7Y4_9ROSI|nr:hypothetical protein Tsubulata_048561 [Turnera subulata]